MEILEYVNREHAAEDIAIRDIARPYLGAFKVDGDSYGHPALEEVVVALCEEIDRLRNRLDAPGDGDVLGRDGGETV